MWRKPQNIPYLIIFFLATVVLIQRCDSCSDIGNNTVIDTVKYVDTTWIERDTLIVKYDLKPAKIQKPDSIPAAYIPSEDCGALNKQYDRLTDEHFSTYYYTDTATLDSSYVVVHDEVSENKIKKRTYDFNLKYPLVKETVVITKTSPPRRQMYFGGGVSGNNVQLINRFDLGLLYKDRKDRIFVVEGTADVTGRFGAEISSYWKLSLRRKQ